MGRPDLTQLSLFLALVLTALASRTCQTIARDCPDLSTHRSETVDPALALILYIYLNTEIVSSLCFISATVMLKHP